MLDKVLAFYIRLSSEDRDLKTNALKNESNSVFNQRRLLQDYYDCSGRAKIATTGRGK